MEVDVAAELGRQALILTVLITMPPMIAGALLGLVISFLQTITSIQEQTLTTAPRILATLIVSVLALPWMLLRLTEYTVELINGIPTRL